MQYDIAGRLEEVYKTLNNDPAKKTRIAKNEYDKLGQLKRKTLVNSSLEDLNYEYNVRGWVIGMNRYYIKEQSDHKFGFELG
jgi:hypothetical protein